MTPTRSEPAGRDSKARLEADSQAAPEEQSATPGRHQFDIMNLDRALTPDERRELASFKAKKVGLHAAEPGTGPAGETCGSCANLYRKRMGKTYLKCALTRAQWTGGGGTDVKARDPSCSKWEKPSDVA